MVPVRFAWYRKATQSRQAENQQPICGVSLIGLMRKTVIAGHSAILGGNICH